MNLPNKLTLMRVVMIPLLVLFMLVPMGFDAQKWIALGIFILASLTDLADGKIARKYNLITNFGKFMDPLADKLLVCSALICLIELHKIPAWIVLIIIAREFIVSGFRLVAADQGIVIADNGCGIPAEHLPKIKQKFYKANQTVRGSGIGLAVADEIVRLHKGTLNIDSVENVGTTVTIKLPLVKPEDETVQEEAGPETE